MPVPARPHLFPQRRYFCTNLHNPLLCQADRSDVNNVKILKTYISWPLPFSTAVFSWVEEAADVGKQGCNPKHSDANDVGVRDSCRQGHPHHHLVPPSARPVPAKTASAECFQQQDWEWCPQSKASPSRQGPRARKRAHVRQSEPCCKFCHTESCTGVVLKELKPKPK